jgi:hypothetical protein
MQHDFMVPDYPGFFLNAKAAKYGAKAAKDQQFYVTHHATRNTQPATPITDYLISTDYLLPLCPLCPSFVPFVVNSSGFPPVKTTPPD